MFLLPVLSAAPAAEGQRKCYADGAVYEPETLVVSTTAPCRFDDWRNEAKVQRAHYSKMVPKRNSGSCDAASFLDSVDAGQTTRDNVEVVISSFKADLSWTKSFADLRTVYEKHSDGCALHASIAVEEDSGAKGGGCIPLPNIGHEAETYLTHIHDRYDSLADWTVFVHDTQPSCGFFRAGMLPWDHPPGNHLALNVSLFDYILAPQRAKAQGKDIGIFMPITGKFNNNLTVWSVRSVFTDLPPGYSHADRPLPAMPPIRQDGGTSGDFWLPWEQNEFQNLIRGIASDPKNKWHFGKPQKAYMSFTTFYEKVFGRPPPPVIYFAQGAQFAVSREAIRRIPKAKYCELLDMFEDGHEELAFYLELIWHSLFTEDIETKEGERLVSLQSTTASSTLVAEQLEVDIREGVPSLQYAKPFLYNLAWQYMLPMTPPTTPQTRATLEPEERASTEEESTEERSTEEESTEEELTEAVSTEAVGGRAKAANQDVADGKSIGLDIARLREMLNAMNRKSAAARAGYAENMKRASQDEDAQEEEATSWTNKLEKNLLISDPAETSGKQSFMQTDQTGDTGTADGALKPDGVLQPGSVEDA